MIVVFPFAATAATISKKTVMAKSKQIEDPDDPGHRWPDGAAIRELMKKKALKVKEYGKIRERVGWNRQDLLDHVNKPRIASGTDEMSMGAIERCLRSNSNNAFRVKLVTLEAIADALGVDVEEIALSLEEVNRPTWSWQDLAANAKHCDVLELVPVVRGLKKKSEHRCRFHIDQEVRVQFALADIWAERVAVGQKVHAVMLMVDREKTECIFPTSLAVPAPKGPPTPTDGPASAAPDAPGLGELVKPLLILPDPSDPEPFVVTEPEGAQTIYALLTVEPFEQTIYRQLLSREPGKGLAAMAQAVTMRPADEWALFKREIEVVRPAGADGAG